RCTWEHLDHTADVQLHAWGTRLEEAFEQCALAMFALMTELETVAPPVEVCAQGHDLHSLLFQFLDEWLFRFTGGGGFVPRRLRVVSLDRAAFRVRSLAVGECFELGRHPQGTAAAVKAITYSAMRITETPTRADLLVIVDI
ncbi:hypothetical protein EMIHUDRAFT_62827, partial [Emiliania huxleyi CCMP1516]|uniref:Archease domain-containing protein n=2 Tax=Emiliania huxleyi TaxID=2903 RepID=A0A0D3KR59_EMIH1